MKLMIASDIHGSAYYCKKMINAFEEHHPEKLILLGDVFTMVQEMNCLVNIHQKKRQLCLTH